MKKRIIELLLAGVLLLSLTACGGGTVGRVPQLVTAEDTASGVEGASRTKPDSTNYEDTLIGLCSYMEDGGAVVKDEEAVSFEDGRVVFHQDNITSFVEMSYKEIGAVGGYRYQFTYNGSTVQAEFYAFDLDDLDEKGQDCLSSTKEKGFFVVLGNKVPALLHPNGKYLMIYTDSKKDEKNEAQKQWAEDLFRSFQA